MKNRITSLAPLGIEVYFFTDRKKFEKELLKNTSVEDDTTLMDGRCLYLQGSEGHNVVYIGVFEDDVSILSHECNHAVLYAFKSFSINPFDSMGEIFCYMQQKLFSDCLTWMKEDYKDE